MGIILRKIKCFNFFSDVIRLILISKFGGWYSDLDMVFLRQVTALANVVASDNFYDQKAKVCLGPLRPLGPWNKRA